MGHRASSSTHTVFTPFAKRKMTGLVATSLSVARAHQRSANLWNLSLSTLQRGRFSTEAWHGHFPRNFRQSTRHIKGGHDKIATSRDKIAISRVSQHTRSNPKHVSHTLKKQTSPLVVNETSSTIKNNLTSVFRQFSHADQRSLHIQYLKSDLEVLTITYCLHSNCSNSQVLHRTSIGSSDVCTARKLIISTNLAIFRKRASAHVIITSRIKPYIRLLKIHIY